MISRQGTTSARLFDRFVAPSRDLGVSKPLVAVSAAVAVAVIAVVDYATGISMSLSVFYLVPTAVAAVIVGTRTGFAIAVESAIVWALADGLIEPRDQSIALQVWNGALRFATLSFVVVLLAALQRSLERARESERRSREFLAFAAHQLRTPVAGLQTTAEALVLQAERASRERLLSNLAREASRVGRLVNALLRVARIDQGESIERRLASIVALCEEEVARVRHVSTLELRVLAREGVPPVSMLATHDVGEVLANLLDNARRHARATVDVVVSASGADLVIEVRDDGPGLPPGTEDRAFERFVSLDMHGGSGLGLAIARGLAERHGGSLVYEVGAFVLRLPKGRYAS